MNKLKTGENVERVRSICLALPEADEIETWGHPTFRVNDKIFAGLSGDKDPDRTSCSFKSHMELRDALVQSQPNRYFVPPYVGNKGWLGVYLDLDEIDWELIEGLIVESYCLIAPKRLVKLVSPR
ncbi:MAG: MmcQ/YjbR family DNA-binding protein [Fimbriimonadia bacterium]|nr:MmcQ/YjbR family DNA-binding protein [Fimbriimonadia bacterium]